MNGTRSRTLRQSLAALAVATLLAACSDRSPTGPYGSTVGRPQHPLLVSGEVAGLVNAQLPNLGSCPQLAAPAGSRLALHAFGKGVQIYRWTGTSWTFVAPQADLFADEGGNGLIGTHFGGPTWVTLSGGKTVGTVSDRCIASATSIPWLRLDAVSDGRGVLSRTRYIQRLNTVGGLAPATPGTVVGETVSVPYTADYYFYWAS